MLENEEISEEGFHQVMMVLGGFADMGEGEGKERMVFVTWFDSSWLDGEEEDDEESISADQDDVIERCETVQL